MTNKDKYSSWQMSDNHQYWARMVRVYDVTKKIMIKEFSSINSCAKYLGVSPSHVRNTIKGKRKMKINTTSLGILLTIR